MKENKIQTGWLSGVFVLVKKQNKTKNINPPSPPPFYYICNQDSHLYVLMCLVINIRTMSLKWAENLQQVDVFIAEYYPLHSVSH